MRWTGRVAVAAMVVTMAGAPATATTLGVYTGISIFGDSLSDPRNASALAGAAFPAEFPLGKASDGPLWSELIAEDFAARGLPVRNFAFAAARVQPDDQNALFPGFPGINLPAQLRNFEAATPAPLAPGHLALFWLGANDLRDALGDFNPLGDPFEELATLSTTAAAAAASLVAQATAVREFGIRDILFVTAPDLSLTPAAAAQPAAAQGLAQLASGIFNTALGAAVSALDLLDPDLRAGVFDINPGFIATLANPGAIGVTEPAALSCLDVIGNPPPLDLLSECGAHFFYDDIHPSSALHAAIT